MELIFQLWKYDIVIATKLQYNSAWFLNSSLGKGRIMVTYVCLAILFLFVVIRMITFQLHRRKPVSREDTDRTLYNILNGGRDGA